MPSILARFDPELEALHDDLLATVPGLSDIDHNFDRLSYAGKREFIKVVENDGSAPYLAIFLELHAAHAIKDTNILTDEGTLEVSQVNATLCTFNQQEEYKDGDVHEEYAVVCKGWSNDTTEVGGIDTNTDKDIGVGVADAPAVSGNHVDSTSSWQMLPRLSQTRSTLPYKIPSTIAARLLVTTENSSKS